MTEPAQEAGSGPLILGHSGRRRAGPLAGSSMISEAVRRALDVAIASTLLVLLSPLLVLVAVAIRLDSPGGVVFRQRRLGRNRVPFTVYKFRTLVKDGDHGLHREYVGRLISGEESAAMKGGKQLFKPSFDAYVTRIGRALRRSSIDELPQLWNVLAGDMSLIGPRPVIPYEADMFPAAWEPRFAVKPGLTGLWQVSGRNRLTYVRMIELDLEYVQRRSLRLDAAILARTIPTVLLRRGVS